MARWQPERLAMASPWRRRAPCTLVAGTASAAALREISGRAAFVETQATPPAGTLVELRHPEAGSIPARVMARAPDGLHLALAGDTHAAGFALAAIVSDMSWPPAPSDR